MEGLLRLDGIGNPMTLHKRPQSAFYSMPRKKE